MSLTGRNKTKKSPKKLMISKHAAWLFNRVNKSAALLRSSVSLSCAAEFSLCSMSATAAEQNAVVADPSGADAGRACMQILSDSPSTQCGHGE